MAGHDGRVMPAFGVSMLYRAKWKNGSVSLLALRSGDDLRSVLEQVGDPDDAEVSPYEGPALVTFVQGAYVRLEDCEFTAEMLENMK